LSSTLYYPDGRCEAVKPSGAHWSLTELQTLVGGYIEVLRTHDGRYLIVDEEGKLKRKARNVKATILYLHGAMDAVVGTALVVDTKLELDGPDDEEDDGGLH
jgi:Domain of unknown function (DUF3846)